MDPFNIVIRKGDQQLDLNIHPQQAGRFKVVCQGALVGEVFMGAHQNWHAVSEEYLEAESYPIYEFDVTSGYADLLLDQQIVQQIGKQIRLVSGYS